MTGRSTSTPSNAQIAGQLAQLAQLLRAEGANRFKVKAYQNAAEALRSYSVRLSDAIVNGGKLPKIPGVGPAISGAIEEIVRSGSLASVTKLSAKLPIGSAAIAEAAGISLPEAARLVRTLDIATPADLEERVRNGELEAKVGTNLAFKVRQGLSQSRRVLWIEARSLVASFLDFVGGISGVRRVEAAGSYRRGQDTVGLIRLVVQLRGAGVAVRRALKSHGGVESVLRETDNAIECKLAAGPMLRVRFTEGPEWGTSLVEETGSDAHLEEVARLGKTAKRARPETEEEWYASRGLSWIPPELREGRGEVEAAHSGELPDLVELSDICGDLHAHTTESDGANTLAEMVTAARKRGYSYLAITDHSHSLKITNGLDEKRLRKQMSAIDKMNRTLDGFRVFKGSEVDILADGTLDFPDSVLRDLDIVMASIHSRFALDKEQQTKRLLRAIANPYVTCLGHLTGRKLLRRPGYDLDVEKVLRAVKRHGKFVEINASPDRLDVSDEVAFRARQLRIPILINTDAHSVREFGFMEYGVQQARRGWQQADSVLNTLELPQLVKRLQGTRKGS